MEWAENGFDTCRHGKLVPKRMISGKRGFGLSRRANVRSGKGWLAMHSTHPDMVAAIAPDRAALMLADTGETVTYGDLVADANQIARVFDSFGLGHGDVIACLLHNGADLWRFAWAAKNAGLHLSVTTLARQG